MYQTDPQPLITHSQAAGRDACTGCSSWSHPHARHIPPEHLCVPAPAAQHARHHLWRVGHGCTGLTLFLLSFSLGASVQTAFDAAKRPYLLPCVWQPESPESWATCRPTQHALRKHVYSACVLGCSLAKACMPLLSCPHSFLMRRAYELAFATTYTFGGARPVFLKCDEITFRWVWVPCSVDGALGMWLLTLVVLHYGYIMQQLLERGHLHQFFIDYWNVTAVLHMSLTGIPHA